MKKNIQFLYLITVTTLSVLGFDLNLFGQTNRTVMVSAASNSSHPNAEKPKQAAAILAALPRSLPESEGMSSAGIIEFLNAADTTSGVEIHSLMIVRNGKVVSEGWWKPYAADYKHIMYSTSKTFTATAVGLAVSEKRLAISDRVVSFFPNSLPEKIGDRMKSLTVKDLLTMSVGQEPGPRITGNDDWIRAFLSIEPIHDPGTTFLYNNMASFMLSSIVQQVTGETVFDYLTPRIFQPLGFRGIDWDMNPQGINLGMSGLRLHTEEMARFGLLLMQEGTWNGKSLIPAAWVKEATSFKIESNDPGNKRPKEFNDWMQGYCYQMWRGRNNSVRFDGARGQFGILIPDKKAVVILTSGSSNTQKEMDLVWKYLLPAMQGGPMNEDRQLTSKLNERLGGLKLPGTESKPAHSSFGSAVSGRIFKIDSNLLNVNAITVDFTSEGVCDIKIKQGKSTDSIQAGANTWKFSNVRSNNLFAGTSMLPSNRSTADHYRLLNPSYKIAASYTWIDSNTLQLSTRFIEERVAAETFLLKFAENGGQLLLSIEEKRTGNQPALTTQPEIKLSGKTVGSR